MKISGISTAVPPVASKPASPAAHATSTASTASSSGSGKISGAPPSVASAANAAVSTLVSSTYSTSAGGKSYSANISETNGTYTLSVPNLPGATVSGSSLSAAESALSVKIDTLA